MVSLRGEPKELFGIELSQTEMLRFWALLKLEPAPLSLHLLEKIIGSFLGKIPFHNLTLLTRERRSPTLTEIKTDMLSGLGGPCGHMNPFLGAFLYQLGFEVHLVAGSMRQPNCHLALLIRLEETSYYCDCGDGKPYFQPMPIREAREYGHPSLRWRIRPVDPERTDLEVWQAKIGWKRNCTIHLKPRAFAFFSDFIQAHYTQDHYGPFQTGFRLVWYPGGDIKGVRDMQFLYQVGSRYEKEQLKNKMVFKKIIQDHFNIPVDLAMQAFEALADRNLEPFKSNT